MLPPLAGAGVLPTGRTCAANLANLCLQAGKPVMAGRRNCLKRKTMLYG